MKAQSAIEFLTTYGFIFLAVGVAIVVIFFLTTSLSVVIPQQCSAFTGPNCNIVNYFSNLTGGYSIATISITNSESVPINITNITILINKATSVGFCTPSFMYPGQESTCTINLSTATSPGTAIRGDYYMSAKFCNSGLLQLSFNNCTVEKVTYGGSFSTATVTRRLVVFSVIAAMSPNTLQLVSYNAINSITIEPIVPLNYTIEESSHWIANYSSASFGSWIYYGYATGGNFLTNNVPSKHGITYPVTLSAMSNNNIACTAPYNSLLSIAYTTLYFPKNISSPGGVTVSMEANNALQVYYRAESQGGQWKQMSNGVKWTTSGFEGTISNTIPVNAGLYGFAILYSDTCGAGLQTFNMTGLSG